MAKIERIYVKLGTLVAKHRVALNISQQELGDKIGLSRASIGNIETGRHRIALHDLLSLAKALDLDAVDLFSRALFKKARKALDANTNDETHST